MVSPPSQPPAALCQSAGHLPRPPRGSLPWLLLRVLAPATMWEQVLLSAAGTPGSADVWHPQILIRLCWRDGDWVLQACGRHCCVPGTVPRCTLCPQQVLGPRNPVCTIVVASIRPNLIHVGQRLPAQRGPARGLKSHGGGGAVGRNGGAGCVAGVVSATQGSKSKPLKARKVERNVSFQLYFSFTILKVTHVLPKIWGRFLLWGVLPGERSSLLIRKAPALRSGIRRSLRQGDLVLQTAFPGEARSAKAGQLRAS